MTCRIRVVDAKVGGYEVGSRIYVNKGQSLEYTVTVRFDCDDPGVVGAEGFYEFLYSSMDSDRMGELASDTFLISPGETKTFNGSFTVNDSMRVNLNVGSVGTDGNIVEDGRSYWFIYIRDNEDNNNNESNRNNNNNEDNRNNNNEKNENKKEYIKKQTKEKRYLKIKLLKKPFFGYVIVKYNGKTKKLLQQDSTVEFIYNNDINTFLAKKIPLGLMRSFKISDGETVGTLTYRLYVKLE